MIKKRKYFFTTFLLIVFGLSSCSEINTTDPIETYKYWAGTNPPSEIELLNGQYWQSAHWTHEYIMYLKIKTTELWWDEFIKQNYISEDKDNWIIPSEAPDWFKPSENSRRYGGGDNFNKSRYFRDNQTGICYIYEIQL